MRLGICTTDFPRMGTRALFQKIAELGFTVAQCNFSSMTEFDFSDTGAFEIPGLVDNETIARMRLESARSGVDIVCVNGTFNCAHPDPAMRAEGIARFRGFARAVSLLGCPLISICTGTRNTESLWKPHPDNETQAAWDDMLAVIKAITDIAQQLKLTLLIETEASNVVNTPEKAMKLMEQVSSPSLKIVMDCANLFHAGDAKKDNARPVMRHAFDVLGGKILLAHGKDIREGAGIDFCATGDGIVDYPYFFELLRNSGYTGDMMLHGIFSEEGMEKAVKLLRPMVEAYSR